ncbi:UxaA family hydrolase [Alsobacter sp. SYSU M60028]|uniref:UxaA family hydrolase n=1 Tax=Alsobacter ponti TaxID=2962936 RepID=A0ABT1LDL4_9HYPH|nr:UxaA family hydrolase [Alsobacter ponti]MCP8939600.1 UxaA family hydrolase [Alsobacter ponti]
MDTHPGLLVLDPGDNIAVATRDLAAGESVRAGDIALTLERATATGHKVAVRPIRAGEKVVKFRVPIGSATRDIRPGDYVHLHNLKSDYIATYTLDASAAGSERA